MDHSPYRYGRYQPSGLPLRHNSSHHNPRWDNFHSRWLKCLSVTGHSQPDLFQHCGEPALVNFPILNPMAIGIDPLPIEAGTQDGIPLPRRTGTAAVAIVLLPDPTGVTETGLTMMVMAVVMVVVVTGGDGPQPKRRQLIGLSPGLCTSHGGMIHSCP